MNPTKWCKLDEAARWYAVYQERFISCLGEAACKYGVASDGNPFPTDSAMHQSWLSGWEYAKQGGWQSDPMTEVGRDYLLLESRCKKMGLELHGEVSG